MELWLATGNRSKLIEFKTLLPSFEIHTQSELSVFSPPPENGKTFEENARIKARSLKAVKTGVWVIGEDSGLEVEGLGNLPGIHSARYAGPKAIDPENVAKLLKMLGLKSANNRKAKFQCYMVIYSPDGRESVINGTVEGSISTKPIGTDGFGYDPVFIPDGETKTFAELGLTRKNQISHRAQAIRKLIEIIN
ncbi:MAG: non-canonical purine NTP pyrophosphatase, RdgB/HAM1 family [Bdellovibrionales bacterium RBG_16_40_8]|nr:MAG: non-canonical purine NTP pyrophosphatase, RdgB/HAM1 family [Bdellovibrionales bacterium RBG_16_40_8]